MSSQGTLESIALSIARLLQPLEEELKAGRIRVLFAELGMEFPPELEDKTDFVNALNKTVGDAGELPDLINGLIKAVEEDDVSKIFSTGSELFSTITAIVDNIQTIALELKKLGGSLPGISAPDLNNFADSLPENLIEFLIIKNLEGTPGFAEALEFINVVERNDVLSGSLSYTTRDININQFFNFVSNPGSHFENLYDWGSSSFDGLKLFKSVEKQMANAGVPVILDQTVTPPVLDFTFLEVKPRVDLDPSGVEVVLLDKIIVDDQEFSMDDWKVTFEFGVELASGFRVIAQPNGKITLIPPAGNIEGQAFLEWIAGNTNGDPYIILGQTGGSRLEAKQFSAKAGMGIKWDATKNEATGDLEVGGQIKGGKFVVDFSQGDGFLSQILSNVNLESDFDIGFGFSSNDGLYFYGSSSLIIQLASHIDLGPIQINALNLGIGLKNDEVPIDIALDFKAELGPLQVVVEQIGVTSEVSFPSDQKGNLGPLNLDFGFKPPTGLGLAINAGAVTGGGYLYFDHENGEYAGALELTIAEFISAKAIGLITTKMPDGSKGFSMLVIITAEFNPPFQLGYGFTLNGVGGLLGLNRTVLLDPLRDGVRTGAVNNIMFPKNVIANATRIISDLKIIFPPNDDKFLIGPMGKVGWGTPSLITLSVGLIIEIPGNVAILGVLKIALPEERIPLVQIQVAFVGTLDFDKKMLTFDASLYESFILHMTLEGDMAVRLKWGDQPDFILTVGGFHPSFNPPPMALPTLRRLSISILNTSIAKIRVECYQAVTSNTVQFGAKAEIYFDLKACSIDGHIAFDALFQFSPFYFIIQLSSSFNLKAAGISVMSVRVKMSLEGTTPWKANGTGSVSLLFISISANFNKTWGDKKDTSLPKIEILPKLIEELHEAAQWSTDLVSEKNLLVTLRKLEEAASPGLILHPSGSLMVQQKLMPLSVNIDKVGNQKTSDIKKAVISGAFTEDSSGTQSALEISEVNENFARAQYQELKDSEKLSKPSFEKMPCGVKITMGNNTIKNGTMVRKKVEYDVTIVDKEPVKPFKFGKFFTEIEALFTNFLKGGAVAKSVLSLNHHKKFQPFEEKLDVLEEGYSVAFQSDNKAFDESATFSSEMMAQSYMQDQISKNPSLKGEVHIIPNFELQAA